MRWEVTEKRQREKLYMRRRFLEWRLKVYEEKSKRNIWRRKNQRSSWGELGLFLGEKMGKKVWILLNGPRMWDIVKDFGSNFEEKKQNKKKVRKLKRKSYSAFDGRYFLEKKKERLLDYGFSGPRGVGPYLRGHFEVLHSFAIVRECKPSGRSL